LKGACVGAQAVGVFDLDLLTVLTAYIFLCCGPVQAGAFAVGQGLLIDIFSGGFYGLFAFIYLMVFLGIYLASLFFDIQTVKGEMIIIGLAVFLKNLLFLVVLSLFSGSVVINRWFLSASLISIIGTGLITPFLFSLLHRLRGITEEENGAAPPEGV